MSSLRVSAAISSREIDAQGLAGVADRPRDLDESVAGAEAHLEDPLAGGGGELGEPQLFHGALGVLGQRVVEARDLVVVVADVVLPSEEPARSSGKPPS